MEDFSWWTLFGGAVLGWALGLFFEEPAVVSTPRLYNVQIEAVDGAYLFYELETNKFLFQTRTEEEGVDRLIETVDLNRTIVFSRTEEEEEIVDTI